MVKQPSFKATGVTIGQIKPIPANPVDLLAEREHKVTLSISEEHKCREAFNVFATKDLPNYIKLTEMKEILRIIGGPSANRLSLER